VYQYIYSYPGSFTNIDPYVLSAWQYKLKLGLKYYLNMNVFDSGLGVAHGDEIFVMFRPHLLPMASVMTNDDATVSNRIGKMFTDFARYARIGRHFAKSN
jgi:hypothetical protein